MHATRTTCLQTAPDGQEKEAELTRTDPSHASTFGDLRQGFVYERVSHITLRGIANNAEIDVIWEQFQDVIEPLRERLNAALGESWEEWDVPREAEDGWPSEARALHEQWWEQRIARQREIDASIAARADSEYLYDKPYADNRKVRVAGPFTVESLSPHRVLGVDEDDELIDGVVERSPAYGKPKDFGSMILEHLQTAGVQQAHKEDRIEFSSVTPWPGEMICAEGCYAEGRYAEGGSGSNGTGAEKRRRHLHRAGVRYSPRGRTSLRRFLSDRRARWGSLGLAIARSCPVTCPHCRSRATSRRLRRTELGYRRFQCRTCRRRFNERTGTRFNEIRFPSDVVMLAVLWRLRYKLSLRDVAEMLLERGYQVTHETVRTWEASFAPLLSERLRAKRRGRIGSSWYIDETYVKVAGRWCYLYRAIDGDGQLIDSMLSEHRDKHAARRFFRGLVDVAEARPLRVTTDRHPAYPRAVRWILGRKVVHRTTQYLNNFMEQDHRGVKQRYYPMRGFGSFVSAARFCTAFDELREYFRSRSRRGQHVSLAEQRRLFAVRWRSLIAEMSAA